MKKSIFNVNIFLHNQLLKYFKEKNKGNLSETRKIVPYIKQFIITFAHKTIIEGQNFFMIQVCGIVYLKLLVSIKFFRLFDYKSVR